MGDDLAAKPLFPDKPSWFLSRSGALSRHSDLRYQKRRVFKRRLEQRRARECERDCRHHPSASFSHRAHKLHRFLAVLIITRIPYHSSHGIASVAVVFVEPVELRLGKLVGSNVGS